MPLTKFFSDSVRAIKSDGTNINAAAAKTTTAQQRIANISAAASTSNPKLKEAYLCAKHAAERLGFSLDKIAEAGGTRELDKAMTEKRWPTEQRIALKSALHAVGAIA